MKDQEPTPRPETGPMQFGDDWPGVFIRGDIAAYFAMELADELAGAEHIGAIRQAVLRGLVATLASSREPTNPKLLQQLRPYAECAEQRDHDRRHGPRLRSAEWRDPEVRALLPERLHAQLDEIADAFDAVERRATDDIDRREK